MNCSEGGLLHTDRIPISTPFHYGGINSVNNRFAQQAAEKRSKLCMHSCLDQSLQRKIENLREKESRFATRRPAATLKNRDQQLQAIICCNL